MSQPQLLMRQTDIDQDRTRWMGLRRVGVTASEIAAVVGVAPPEYGSAWSVYAAKITGQEFQGDTDATLRGTHLEAYVADRFAAERPTLALGPGGLYHSKERPWQMATFDRLAFEARDKYAALAAAESGELPYWADFYGKPVIPVQIKTSATYEGWGPDGSDQIPVHYRAQCLQEMDVADAGEIIVPTLFVGDWKLRVYRIVRDSDAVKDIMLLRKAAVEFLDRVAHEDEPEIDWTPATTKALKTLRPELVEGEVFIKAKLARRYKAARIAVAKAERQLAQASNEIEHAAGDAKFVMAKINGQPVKIATRLHYPKTGGYDIPALVAKHAKLMARNKRPDITVDSMTPGTWAKAPKRVTIRPARDE